jgi:transketolase
MILPTLRAPLTPHWPMAARRWSPAAPFIGKGAPNKQGTHNVHGSAAGRRRNRRARASAGLGLSALRRPGDILAHWRSLGAPGAEAR